MREVKEGAIKFNCTWIKDNPFSCDAIAELTKWRDTLYALGLIGAYSNGIGFGNISVRITSNTFLISGSGTGTLPVLKKNHFVQVIDYNLAKNSLTCQGPLKASSESLSHAAVYEISPDINAVIHIHHGLLWEKLRGKVPTTDEKIPYGCPEMAFAINDLFKKSDFKTNKILVMGGHEEGIISFGKDLEEAGENILKVYKSL